MDDAVRAVCALCMLAAICGQLLDEGRFAGAVRFVLGLELTWTVMSVLEAMRT